MKPPKTIQVGPVKVTTKFVPDFRDERNDKLLGRYRENHQDLQLEPNQGPDCMADTVLHELMHAVWRQGALPMMKSVGDDEEEAIVRHLAPGLLDVLRRNPRLVEFLLDV